MSMLKNIVYFGIGALSISREKAEKVFSEMVEKGEMSSEEARQWVDDVIKRGEEERGEFKDLVRKEIEEIKKELPLATKSDLETIEARLKAIEEKLQ